MGTKTIGELFDLTGKAAIVTGGAAGIGQAIALRLAEAGAAVTIADIDTEGANRTASEIQARGGKSIFLAADARSADDARQAVRATVRAFGSLDILVNNAGIYPICPFMNITEELWDRVLTINLKGTFLYSQAAADVMIKGGRGGRIINIASIDALHPNGSVAHYNASKGGLLMLTKAMALELAPHRILVNAVAPGATQTPGTQALREGAARAFNIDPEQIAQAFVQRVPLGRMGEPDDVARIALFLASAAADYITGDLIVVDGGFLLS